MTGIYQRYSCRASDGENCFFLIRISHSVFKLTLLIFLLPHFWLQPSVQFCLNVPSFHLPRFRLRHPPIPKLQLSRLWWRKLLLPRLRLPPKPAKNGLLLPRKGTIDPEFSTGWLPQRDTNSINSNSIFCSRAMKLGVVFERADVAEWIPSRIKALAGESLKVCVIFCRVHATL